MRPATRLAVIGGCATMLTSLCLVPLFEVPSPWIGRAVIIVACVVGIGVGLRRLGSGARHTSTFVVVVVQTAFVGWTALRMADSSTFLAHVIPTRASVGAFADAVDAAFVAMNDYAAPIPDDRNVVILTAATIGLVAVVVDAIVVGRRQAAWAGLPLLAVYAIPATVLPAGLGVLAFLGPAVGYLLLLATEGSLRIRGWGAPVGLGSSRGRRAGRAATTDASSGTSPAAVTDAGLPVAAEPGTDDASATPAEGDEDPDDTVRVPLLGSTGRRIGFAALALAIAVPALLPDLNPRVPSSGGNGTGGEGRVIAVGDPVVDLNRDLRRGRNIPLFTFRTTTDAGKAAAPDYLRTVVLDDFDGTTWKPSPRTVPTQNSLEKSAALPGAPGWVSIDEKQGDRYAFDVTSDYSSTWLPLAYPPSRITVDGDWRYDSSTLDVVSAQNGLTTAGISYTEEAVGVEAVASRLRDAGPAPGDLASRYTSLPALPPGQVTALVESVTKGHEESRYDMALAIQNYFRTQFKYSLDREPGTGSAALIRFLNDKSGYCEQFAATMALMARIKGIPARVAVGFLPGEKQADGSYVVRSHDAHAWPELYFAGTGWVRFEPTPATRTGNTPSWLNPANLDGGQPDTTNTSRATASSAAEQPNAAPSAGPDPSLDPTQTNETTVTTTSWWKLPLTLAIIVLVILLLLTPAAVRIVRRRRRLRQGNPPDRAAELAWAELLDTCRDLGVELPAGASPRATATALREGVGRRVRDHASGTSRIQPPAPAAGASEARIGNGRLDAASSVSLNDLVRLVEEARYSGRRPSPAAAAVAGDLAERVMHAVRSPLRRSTRLRAVLMPASLADAAGAWSLRIKGRGDGVDTVDRLETTSVSARRRDDDANAARNGS